MQGNIYSIGPRGIAIGLAVVLFILGAAAIGIINGTDGLKLINDYNSNAQYPGSEDYSVLQALLVGTEGSSAWIIVLSIIVIAVEITAVVLLYVTIPAMAKLIVGIVEIIFGVAMILCYFSTGISVAVYAAAWGGPPTLCNYESSGTDYCNSIPLTAVCALQALLCFIQIGIFGAVIAVTARALIQSRSSGAAAPPATVVKA